jgi:hypothetical protein
LHYSLTEGAKNKSIFLASLRQRTRPVVSRPPLIVSRSKICVMKKIVTRMVALSLLCAIFSCNRTIQKEMDSLQSVIQNSITHPPPPVTEGKIRRTDIQQSNTEPCIPDFDPEPTITNGCINHCQWVYEGWASTADDFVHVNCIDNPSNWSLTVKASGENQYFQFRVFHNPINYAEYWDCYEPGSFNFRVTARMELPIWIS